MLPTYTPEARILRYGYESNWFGQEAMRTSVSVVADRLLLALRRMRKVPKSQIMRRIKNNQFRGMSHVHCFSYVIALADLWSLRFVPETRIACC
jgi:hypothetical protein